MCYTLNIRQTRIHLGSAIEGKKAILILMTSFMPKADFGFEVTEILGRPIPFDEHGISVTLAKWSDVVGYEEGEKRVMEAMRIGYPRFKIHASVQSLKDFILAKKMKEEGTEVISKDLDCIILPTTKIFDRFKSFFLSELLHGGLSAVDIEVDQLGYYDVCAAFFPRHYSKIAKAFWQHTGEILSSRAAEETMVHLGIPLSNEVTPLFSDSQARVCVSDALKSDIHDYRCIATESILAKRIGDILQQSPEDNSITLTVSGMASIYTALRLVHAIFGDQNSEIVVFGFPYIDTLKLMQKPGLNPGGVMFFGHGNDDDFSALEKHLVNQESQNQVLADTQRRVRAVFTECASNPLLKVYDLARLTSLAKKYDFLLVIDDTIANFANVDLFGNANDSSSQTEGSSNGVQADIICTSLSKIFSGRGDVIAGSLCINRNSRYANSLRSAVKHLDVPPLYILDAFTLEVNSRDFLARSTRINDTAAKLVCWLLEQNGIKHVYYPSNSASSYSKLLRSQANGTLSPALLSANYVPGFGGLFSIVLQKNVSPKIFFDSLAVLKGPSLGTSFTLVCPYTLLAHYTELDWASSYGVEADLIRVSVGLEDLDHLKMIFSTALESAISIL